MHRISQIKTAILRFAKSESGAVASEYALLIVFIAIVATLGMVILGPGLADYFDAVTRLVPNTSANPPCPFGCT
jgi:Flp pilus assembly pilin Flp